MPIQPKCKKCGRLGGYTSNLDSGLCHRCILKTPAGKKKAAAAKAASDADEDEDEDENEDEDEDE